ncbi:MAG: leucyl aminopeptidase [Pontibacterium sp.]
MEIKIASGELASLTTGCLIIGITEDIDLSTLGQFDQSTLDYLNEVITSGDIKGKLAQTLLLRDVPGLSAKRVLLLGLGKAGEQKDRDLKKAITGAMSAISGLNSTDITFALLPSLLPNDDRYRQIRHFIEWAGETLYQYDTTKSDKADAPLFSEINFYSDDSEQELAETALLDATAIINGVSTARELGNLPGNFCTPTYLAEQAIALGEENELLSVEVLDEVEMAELGMNSLLSVGHGSEQPSKLIVMKYQGAAEDAPNHVIVGKGITFDTGGISLKPGAKMDEMKFDMCGAASVLGTMTAICDMSLELNVIGVIASAENMPSGHATKPGDVVTTMSGKTVEILNTDAEGRLVLCDALTYVERFEPETVVDIATLTGACIVALGNHNSGLLSNDDGLAAHLYEAGQQAYDTVWRLPMGDDYQDQLKSNFADIANIGGPAAGTITAACFLSRFTESYKWAHLDIAGTAWHSGGSNKGATGRCVPLLCQHLMNLSVEDSAE